MVALLYAEAIFRRLENDEPADRSQAWGNVRKIPNFEGGLCKF